METTFWQKQTANSPLFEDLIWSRPENKKFAGKLLVIGGNLHGFTSPAMAYQVAINAGIGEAKVLLPDALAKSVGKIFEHGEYLPSTSSGSLSKAGLGYLLEQADIYEGVLIAGELGRNSETSMLFESFVDKYTGKLCVTKDALDYFVQTPQLLFDRPDTLIVASLAQLQKFASTLKSTTAFTISMDLNHLADALKEFSQKHKAIVVVKHLENIWVANDGRVSSTKLETEKEIWRVETATKATVWWLQNPEKLFEAVTSSLVTD